LARDPFRCNLCGRVPQPNGGIKAFVGQIGQTLGKLQLELHLRIALLKFGQQRPEPQPAKTKAADHANGAGGLALALAQFVFDGGKALQQLGGAVAQGVAFRGRAHAACRALKEPHTQTRFQCRQALGHHGWSQLQGSGGFAEAAVLPHGQCQFKIGTVQLFSQCE
jgi:hypothetical protein